MHWTLENVEALAPERAGTARDGRFVLHRHHDAAGPHLDLRMETGGCLAGWRVDGDSLAPGATAGDKAPHPLRWLEQDGSAQRLDRGEYAWESRDGERWTVILRGARGALRLVWRRERGLSPADAAVLARAAGEHGVPAPGLAALAGDGAEARDRAVARLCALGRRLDGARFDEASWRALLGGRGLREITGHLAAFEARLDELYPPEPASRPEALDGGGGRAARADRNDAALRLLLG